MDVIHVQLLKSFTSSLPCVYDTPALRCWSAGSRSAVTFPCRYEWGPCEPPRSAPHPPPHTWNGNLSFTFHLRQKMEASADYEHAFLPDLQDLLRLFFGVRGGGDDEQPIEEIDGDAVRALIVCSTDSAGRRVSSTLLMTHPNYSVLPLLKRKADWKQYGLGKQYRVMPLLVAIMRTGERSLSRARFKKEKHSMSSICTSSINNTYNKRETFNRNSWKANRSI